MQFVWTYWHGGALEDELRWSIRSVEANFISSSSPKITIVGDCPPWYQGHWIPKPRIPEVALHNWMDVISKIELISRHFQIDDVFVWMMDDIYLINRCDYLELNTPRILTVHGSATSNQHKKWKNLKKRTGEALTIKGFPTHDYATHLPHVIVKSSLRKLFFDFHIKQPLIWEMLYGNVYRENPVDCHPFLHRHGNPLNAEEADKICEFATILNHGNKPGKGWTPEFREWLAQRFPHPSKVERLV